MKNEFLRGKPKDMEGEKRLSFLFKLIASLIILIGLQVSAQVFAGSVGYDSGWAGKPDKIYNIAGRPFYVYAFWKMFYWALAYWKRTEI